MRGADRAVGGGKRERTAQIDRVALAWARHVANRIDEVWQRPGDAHEGVGIYATHSGSFVLWDSIGEPGESKEFSDWSKHYVVSRDDVWDGFTWTDRRSKKIQVSNGLVRDWASWQGQEKAPDILKTFIRCLHDLSPPDGPSLRPGRLATIAGGDVREFPTIRMPYGDIAIIYASAGVQRILALAYVLLWHWQRHVSRCTRSKRSPFERMVVIVDEIESHLHPRWQRQILPSILKTIEKFAPDLKVQFHVSTHSPLVMASMESNFSLETDATCHYIPKDTGSDTVEHFTPKRVNPALAYEWSNFRLVCGRLNGRKGDHQDVLDPASITASPFQIDFPSLQLKISENLNKDIIDLAESTIVRLKLNEERCIESRQEYVENYCNDIVSLAGLQRYAPFLYYELNRQDLSKDELRKIMSYSS